MKYECIMWFYSFARKVISLDSIQYNPLLFNYFIHDIFSLFYLIKPEIFFFSISEVITLYLILKKFGQARRARPIAQSADSNITTMLWRTDRNCQVWKNFTNFFSSKQRSHSNFFLGCGRKALICFCKVKVA